MWKRGCRLVCFVSLVFLLLFVGCQKKESILEISNLLKNPQSYDGKEVSVRGKIALDPLQKCTKVFCSEENPCCNTCGGKLLFVNDDSVLHLVGKDLKCSGNNCEMVCTPLEVNKEYTIKGIFRSQGSILEVKEYSLAK